MNQTVIPDKHAEHAQMQAQQLLKTHLDEYISQLSETEKRVLKIAKEHLETSFSLENSIGFKKWIKNKLPA